MFVLFNVNPMRVARAFKKGFTVSRCRCPNCRQPMFRHRRFLLDNDYMCV